jgi:HK97 family phage prohead protease
MTEELLSAREFGVRSYALDDITIRSDGDGRTVEAYAAAFNVDAEIRDADGHYFESLSPESFNKTIADNGTRFGVFYNHARTIYGTPDGQLSVPIGVPIEVRTDERGVFTATRYLDNPLADSVLNGIKEGAIRGQSFSGRFIKSMRSRAAKGSLPRITRQEVAMREYGPTVFPAYVEAAILGTRGVTSFLDEIAALAPEEVERLRNMLGLATPLESVASADTSAEAVHVEEPANTGHSARQTNIQALRWKAREKGVI